METFYLRYVKIEPVYDFLTRKYLYDVARRNRLTVKARDLPHAHEKLEVMVKLFELETKKHVCNFYAYASNNQDVVNEIVEQGYNPLLYTWEIA